MPKITFITLSGEKVATEAAAGTLMEVASDHGVEGISGFCGGVGSCATCHVHIAEEWMDKVGQPDALERDTLELLDNATERSRLACQIELTDELDGLLLEVAKPE